MSAEPQLGVQESKPAWQRLDRDGLGIIVMWITGIIIFVFLFTRTGETYFFSDQVIEKRNSLARMK